MMDPDVYTWVLCWCAGSGVAAWAASAVGRKVKVRTHTLRYHVVLALFFLVNESVCEN